MDIPANPEGCPAKGASCDRCVDVARAAVVAILTEKGYSENKAKGIAESRELTTLVNRPDRAMLPCGDRRDYAEFDGAQFARRYRRR